jgi:hypothetical protein
LHGLLCVLSLLSFTFNFESITGPFAGRAQLIQPGLLWRFGFNKLEYSHAFIYGDR